eukprot:m.55523 g.55523  ORF g.55523 m.55523 type:complete len:132 (-) comp12536_c0_seq1:257-652(-)
MDNATTLLVHGAVFAGVSGALPLFAPKTFLNGMTVEGAQTHSLSALGMTRAHGVHSIALGGLALAAAFGDDNTKKLVLSGTTATFAFWTLAAGTNMFPDSVANLRAADLKAAALSGLMAGAGAYVLATGCP